MKEGFGKTLLRMKLKWAGHDFERTKKNCWRRCQESRRTKNKEDDVDCTRRIAKGEVWEITRE